MDNSDEKEGLGVVVGLPEGMASQRVISIPLTHDPFLKPIPSLDSRDDGGGATSARRAAERSGSGWLSGHARRAAAATKATSGATAVAVF